MRRSLDRFGIVALALVAGATAGRTQTTSCLSVQPNGLPSSGYAVQPSMSADGRWVAFQSDAVDLAPGWIGYVSVYVRDLATGTTARVSVDSAGQPANGAARGPVISADGRWVAFASSATNLVPGSTPIVQHVYLRDLLAGTTTRVSVTSAGAPATAMCVATAISADGRFVVFETLAALVASDVNGVEDVYVHDRISGVTSRASVDSSGAGSAGVCSWSSISADGQRVAFTCAADDLVAGDSNGGVDVFVHDFASGTTRLVSAGLAGGSSDLGSIGGRISGDGNTVVFASPSTNLVAPAPAPAFHAFARDLALGTTSLVDVSSAGVAGDFDVGDAYFDVSHDGRFVTFSSRASNLVANDTNADVDVFLRDRRLALTQRASVGATGQQADDGSPRFTAVSDDGRFVAFHAESVNLVPADTNGLWDVFVRDLGGTPTGSTFCFGDGTGAPCPCGNEGRPGHGCGHGANWQGGELFGAGVASVSADTLRLGARDLPPAASCLFFQGTAALGGGAGVPFGDGLRCAGGTVARLATRFATSGGVAYHPRPTDAPISVTGSIPSSPSTRTYQVWFRNASTFCTAATFNLTNAVEIHWTP